MSNLRMPAPTSAIGRARAVLARRTEGRAVALLLVVAIVAIAFEPVVFSSFQVVLGRLALIGLVALGLTALILLGELDLSVASTLALSGVVMARIPNVGLGIIAALITGILVGLINAFFVVVVGINSFIATLGMLFALRGAAFVISSEKPVPLQNIDAGITFGSPLLGPLTPRVLLFFAIFAVLQILLSRTRIGREFYAVGGNRQAAVDVGIPVRRRLVLGFVISGVVAATAGVINTLELTAADPTAGSTVLLASFAAAIIGGVVLTGGRGTILGTLLGALALSILQVVLTLSGVSVDIQDIFVGSILLMAIISDPSSLRTAFARTRAVFTRSRARDTARGVTGTDADHLT